MGDSLGDNTMTRTDSNFVIKQFDVYLDDDTNPTFYALGEKTLSFSPEFAEYFEGIPQTLVRKDLTKFGMACAFTISDFSARAMELARGGDYYDDGTYENVYYGTNYTSPTTHKYTFVGELISGKAFEFVIYKGGISEMPDLTTGNADYAGLPVVVEALKDTTIVNTARNLGYFRFEK